MRKVVVLDAYPLAPTVRGLVLACTDGQPVGHIPGQWVNLHVPLPVGAENKAASAEQAVSARDKRAYSIASAPDPRHPERFELAVTRVDAGSVSLALHELGKGAQLEMDGPHGFFTRETAADGPALFVGTGTGISPLKAIIEAETALRPGPDAPPLTLLFGCRTEQDMLYRSELAAISTRCPRFASHVTLSRPSNTWTGWTGYVQTHLHELIDPSARPHVYICGLTRMVSEVRRVLKEELNYDRKMIHSERYD